MFISRIRNAAAAGLLFWAGASGVAEAAPDLIIPQVVIGQGIATEILLTNSSDAPQQVVIDFFTPAGTPMQVGIEGVVGSSEAIQLAAGGSARIEGAFA